MEDIQQLNYKVAELPASTSKDVRIQFSDSAELKIVLKTPVLERFSLKEIPYNNMPSGLEIEFIDSLGNVDARVTCNRAIHYPKKEILELYDDVQVVNKDGDKLNSEHVVWSARNKKITSDDFVKITTEDEIIYGDGFVANQDFSEYEINHIKGIVSVDEEEFIEEDEDI